MSQGSLSVRVRNVKNITVIDLTGRLILGDSERMLRSTIRDLLEGGQKNLAVNLAEVSYIDSSGIGCLASAWMTSNKNGARFKLFAIPSRVRLMLKMSRIDSMIEVFEDEASALSSF
jgi:anti-sigma B factor antagonist